MEEPQKESENVLLQMKETLNDHRNINLSEIFKEKECIEARIGDFDIDCVLDEETQVNIMTERTWETLGKPAMIPSLGGIGLFRGKLITLCGRLTQISMSAHGTSTEEDFEIVKFIENNAPFSILLGKPWIEKDQARRKEEEVLEKKKQELKDFMTRRITHLIEEQENRSKLLRTRNLDVEVKRTQEDSQKTEVPTPEREDVLLSDPMKESQQREVTMPKGDKNQNGKRNTETKITGKKARKLSKKRKDRKVTEGPRGDFAEGRFARLELRRDIRTTQHGTSPWRSDIAVESIITISPMTRMVRTTVMARRLAIRPLGPCHNG
jgi:hypothetical protein